MEDKSVWIFFIRVFAYKYAILCMVKYMRMETDD